MNRGEQGHDQGVGIESCRDANISGTDPGGEWMGRAVYPSGDEIEARASSDFLDEAFLSGRFFWSSPTANYTLLLVPRILPAAFPSLKCR